MLVQIDFVAPVRRRLPASSATVGGVFGSRTVSGTRLIVLRDRIEHRHVVGAQLERAVEQAVGVERRIAAIGRDHVVQVRLRIGPVPLRDDDVALEALRPRRRRRHLAARRCDRSSRRTSAARAAVPKLIERRRSSAAGLARLHAAIPRVRRATGTCRAPSGSRASPWCRADGTPCSRPTSACASTRAWLFMFGEMPLPLSAGAGELALRRAPASARTSSRPGSTARGVRVRRGHGGQVQRLARASLRPSASRPARSRAPRRCSSPSADRAADSGPRSSVTTIFTNCVGRSRGLGDHPDAGLGPFAAAHDAAEIVGIDRDRGACCRALIEVNETASRAAHTCGEHAS